MENLIVLAIIVLASAVHGWIKRRQDQGQEEPETESWPGSPRPPRGPNRDASGPRPMPKPATDWEEELRRLLQGEKEKPAPPPVQQQREMPPSIPPPIPQLPSRIPDVPLAGSRPAMEASVGHSLEGTPAFSTRPHHSAEEWQLAIEQRMKAAGARLSPGDKLRGAARPSLESHLPKDFIKNRVGLRTAIVASVILGPPKALETS